MLLLPGDDGLITNSIGLERWGCGEVSPQFPCLVCNPERHDLLANCLVSIVLFGVGKASHLPPLDKWRSVGIRQVGQETRSMTKSRRYLLRRKEFFEELL